MSGAASFDDLDDAQLAILLRQRGGFVGTATFEGNLAVWNHEIDFQLINGKDTAHLEQDGTRQSLPSHALTYRTEQHGDRLEPSALQGPTIFRRRQPIRAPKIFFTELFVQSDTIL